MSFVKNLNFGMVMCDTVRTYSIERIQRDFDFLLWSALSNQVYSLKNIKLLTIQVAVSLWHSVYYLCMSILHQSVAKHASLEQYPFFRHRIEMDKITSFLSHICVVSTINKKLYRHFFEINVLRIQRKDLQSQ